MTTFHRLLRDHGSASAALHALPEIARESGVSDYRICPEGVVAAELKAGGKAGARLIALGDSDYPSALALIPDAPPLLWVKGDTSIFECPIVALVGARNASSMGLRMARALSRDLGAEGFAIASGLARGIDGAVHSAALDTGTVAVLAGGVDVIYPNENAELYHKIVETGLVVSEQPMGMKPFARHFPMRNRIVSGMALATVVIEAAAKSGSLLTAGNALDQGREVLAVPGHPFDGRSAGCNILLRDGAGLVRGARDVIDVLAQASPLAATHETTPVQAIHPPNLRPDPASITPARGTAAREFPEQRTLADHAALHSEILARLGVAPLPEDQLIREIGFAPDRISAEILTLELDGRIARKPGGLLARR